jgi:hypothetical protein
MKLKDAVKRRSLATKAPRAVAEALRNPPPLRELGPKVTRAWRAAGFRGLWLLIDDRLRLYRHSAAYCEWVGKYDTLTDDDRARIAQLSEALYLRPNAGL